MSEEQVRISEQVPLDKGVIVSSERVSVLVLDDRPAELERRRSDRELVSDLIDDGVEHSPRRRFFSQLVRRAHLVEEQNLLQQRVLVGIERGAVDNTDFVAQALGDTRQRPRVGRNPGALAKSQIATIVYDVPQRGGAGNFARVQDSNASLGERRFMISVGSISAA
jgi:hypothetical protein